MRPSDDRKPLPPGGREQLAEFLDSVLIHKVLPPSLRISLDNLLKAGESEDVVYLNVLRAAGGKRNLIVLAVEAYLGRAQDGTAKGGNVGRVSPVHPSRKDT